MIFWTIYHCAQRPLKTRLTNYGGRGEQPDPAIISGAAHRQLAQELAQRAITLVRDEAHLLPLKLPADGRIAALMPQPTNLTPADTSSFIKPGLADAIRQYHPAVDAFITPFDPDPASIAALKERIAQGGYDLLIVGTINASMTVGQAALARELLALAIPTVMAALRVPYDCRAYPQAKTYLCSYGILPPTMAALAAALFGQAPISGRLPVTIAGLYPSAHGQQRIV